MTTMQIDRAVVQQVLQALLTFPHDISDEMFAAIAALKAALAQKQAEPLAWLQPKTVSGHLRPDLGYETCSSVDYGAFPVYRAPPKAEPVQEPVAQAVAEERKRLLSIAQSIYDQEVRAVAHYARSWHAAHEWHMARQSGMADMLYWLRTNCP